ncbi:MAG TPA: S-methyl-5'-thioinosine phosphorylase [Burkholderiales bacterium]|jgi:5'-methylthioinosine phosphorylase|nr:S-methyl-5'-thioinosine phosphorylase [Burkholderiales bacterium]
MLAIIGGTGLTKLANLEMSHQRIIRTPYGEASGALTFGQIKGYDVIFLARHGYGHTIPPHQVNYRANIWALHTQHVTHVVSVASVGGIRPDLTPGTIAIPDQIIDYTHGRQSTFFDSTEKPVTHIDFTWPYCEKLRQLIITAAEAAKQKTVRGGVYGATQGPRLESAAEISRLERDGADMVGMTGMPEAALAKELEMCYATVAVVANYAAGKGTSEREIQFENLEATMQESLDRVKIILEKLIEHDGG